MEPSTTPPPSPVVSRAVESDEGNTLITDLTTPEQILYVQTWQDRFNTFHASRDALPYGSQKRWVIRNVMAKFQDLFGNASDKGLDVCLHPHPSRIRLTSFCRRFTGISGTMLTPRDSLQHALPPYRLQIRGLFHGNIWWPTTTRT